MGKPTNVDLQTMPQGSIAFTLHVLSLCFLLLSLFVSVIFVKDHWRDHCKLEEYYDWDHRNQEFARFLFSCLERKPNQ